MMWRSSEVDLLGVPLARPPRRPRPSFFCRGITIVVFGSGLIIFAYVVQNLKCGCKGRVLT